MEIERKWILKSFPKLDYKLVKENIILQTYLHVDEHCEIRLIASTNTLLSPNILELTSKYFLTTKVGAGLSRVEVQTEISLEKYKELKAEIPDTMRPIVKEHFKFAVPDSNYFLSISLVDRVSSKGGWLYAEIEFPSEEEANKFVCPFEDWVEVTEDPYYAMKNYWLRLNDNQ